MVQTQSKRWLSFRLTFFNLLSHVRHQSVTFAVLKICKYFGFGFGHDKMNFSIAFVDIDPF